MYRFVVASMALFSAMGSYNMAHAGNVLLCPDMSQAKQVGECAEEDEIKSMFKRTFGLECDPQAKDSMECEKYAEFKQQKYAALWESSDGEFMGYATCQVPASEINMAKPASVAISQKNGLYKITCNYQQGVSLSMRTRSVCRIPGKENAMTVTRASCSDDPSTCKVECE